MNHSIKTIFTFFIVFGFASNIQALLPMYKIPGNCNSWFKESPSDVLFKNSWAGCETSPNFWQDLQASALQNCAIETHLNTHETTCTIFANTKIVKLTFNTALLVSIVALGIAYKMGYFKKIKKYFNPCDDDSDETSNNE
jgi:hypothetical protein